MSCLASLVCALQLSANIVTVADWAQTREIAVNPIWNENNIMLGQHPSLADVNRYFVLKLVAVNAGVLLNDKYKVIWFGYHTIESAEAVISNHMLGINMKF